MSIEQKLDLKPREPIQFGFVGEPSSRLLKSDGKTISYRVSFLDQTEDPDKATAPLHVAVKKMVDGIVGVVGRESASSRAAPFASLPVPLDSMSQSYLDVISVHPTLDMRTFQQLVSFAPEIERRIKAMYFNSLANEPSTPNIEERNVLYMNRLSLLAGYLPKVINDALDAKGISSESKEAYAVKRTVAGVFTHILKNIWKDDRFAAEVKAKLGSDRHQYLNAAANEFVLSGMEATPAAIEAGLRNVNPYNITPAAYSKIAAVMRTLLNGKHEAFLANPGNIEKILADAESKQLILGELKDLSAIAVPVQAIALSRDWIRRQLAAKYSDELRGYLTTLSEVEKLVKGDRKTVYNKLGIVDGAAKTLVDKTLTEAERGALDTALRGYARLVTNAAVARELAKIVRNHVDVSLPEVGKIQKIDDNDPENPSGIIPEFKSGGAYVFSEKGPVHGKQTTSASTEGGPAILVPTANPIFAFFDIRGFTPLTEKYGTQKGAQTVRDILYKAGMIVTEQGGEVVNYPGDAIPFMFEGSDAPQRYLIAAAGVQDFVRAWNKEALEKKDPTLVVGIGSDSSDFVRYDNMPHKKGINDLTYIVARGLNVGSRLSTTAHADLAKLLEQYDSIERNGEIKRKPGTFVRNALVDAQGRVFNASHLVTEAVAKQFRDQLSSETKTIDLDANEYLLFNNYFHDDPDPNKRTNKEIQPAIESFDVEVFYDKEARRPRILWKHPHPAKLKGIDTPIVVYEVLPESFLYGHLTEA